MNARIDLTATTRDTAQQMLDALRNPACYPHPVIDGVPTPFDCIEFDPALRWIDVVSEAAFLMMDLEGHGRRDLAYVFLNAYLEASGDYNGVAVLPFYLVHRAVVRLRQ